MKQISKTLNTGDINLACSLMSVGIPLDQQRPCSLVLSDDGRTYIRFHILPTSCDGKFYTERLFDYWKKSDQCSDPIFTVLMDFVKLGRESGAKYADDWFELAHKHLIEVGASKPNHPSRIKDIPDFISDNKEGIDAHIFAFVYNRDYAWRLMTQARRRVLITRGNSHAMIDTDLQKWKTNELLARLEG